MKQGFKKSDSAFTTIIVAVVCLIHLVPFYLATNIALKPRTDLSSKWQPAARFQLDNFTSVWYEAHLSRTFVNNILITLGSVLLITIIGALAAYPLARYPSRLNRLVYLFCISIMVVPPLTILVSLYKLVVGLGGINQYWAIIAIETTFNLPLAIFMYTGFIRNLPRELDEAAIMDGCSRFGIFPRIIMPLLKPVTATVVIINSVFVWNDFQFALFFLQRPEVQTLSVVMSQFFSQYQNNLPWAAAGCLLGMVPVALLYLFLQKYFVSGLADGAVKG